jgi:hypothetical protein
VGQPRIYCVPSNLALNVSNYIDILDRQIEKDSKTTPARILDKSIIGLKLLSGLLATFPCPTGK